MEVNERDFSEVEGGTRSPSLTLVMDMVMIKMSLATVGVGFLEKVDPGLLADPYLLSGWVGKMLDTVKLMKVTRSGFVMFVCVSSAQSEQALCATQLGSISVSCFALRNRAPLKGLISGVVLCVEVEQLKFKIPGVCEPAAPSQEHGDAEVTQSVLLSFERECLPRQSHLRLYQLSC